MTGFQILESVVGWIANIAQIVTIAFAIWLYWRARRRFVSMQNGLRGGRHGAMLISIGGGSIKGQVESVLKQLQAENSTIQEICLDEEIVRQGQLSAQQQVSVLPQILESKQRLTDLGVTHSYIFYRGPVALAMGIGALLDNWVPVTVFQFDGGTYKPILVLGQGAVRNFRTDILVESEKTLLDQMLSSDNTPQAPTTKSLDV